MFLNEDDDENLVHEFIQHTAMELGIDPLPEIQLHTDPEWSTNNHTIGRNGLKIAGTTTDLTCSTKNACFGLQYSGATNGWVVIL